MAYALGFMFADGSLVDSNKSSRTFYLSFYNTETALLQAIRESMSSSHKIYVKPRQVMEHKIGKYTSRPCYIFRLGNKVLYGDLIKLGMKHRKSNDMLLPSIPDQYFEYFLRGYLDGDGCIGHYLRSNRISRELRVIFTSGSKVFLLQLSEIIKRLIGVNKLGIYQSTGAFNLTYRGYSSVKICEYIYRDLLQSPYLLRKYEKFREYCDKYMGVRIKKRLAMI